MRALIGLVALLLAPAANASFVRFEIEHLIEPPDHIYDPSAPLLDLSFTLDTSQWLSSDYTFEPTGAQCLGSFAVSGIAVSNIKVAVGDETLWESGSGSANFRGDKPSPACPSGYFGFLGLTDPDHSYALSIDFGPTPTLAEFLASDDPLQLLLFNATNNPAASGRIVGEWGTKLLTLTSIRAYDVPEPAAITLLGAGLLGLIVARRRAR